MIKFDSRETAEAILLRTLYKKIGVGLITVLIVFALVLAVCSRYAENNWGLYIGGLAFYGVLLVLSALYGIFFFARANAAAVLCVCKTVAAGIYAREELLQGETVRLSVSYSGDVLTLSRKDFKGKLIISPAAFTDNKPVAEGGSEIAFDLTALKPAPALYASVGEKLLCFLRAYYLKNAERANVKSAAVTDETGGKPWEAVLVENGTPAEAGKNYFIKRGLIDD